MHHIGKQTKHLGAHVKNLKHFLHSYQENEKVYINIIELFQLKSNTFHNNSVIVPLNLIMREINYQHS